MRRALAAVASTLFLALTAASCAPALWERRETLSSPDARLFVPRLFEPLLPGSIYPDRRRPVPARGRPGVLVVGQIDRESLAPLGERGLVVLVLRRADGGALARSSEVLRGRGETRAAPIALWLLEPTPALVRVALAEKAAFAATVLFGFVPSSHQADAGTAPGPFLVLERTPGLVPSADLDGALARALGGPPVQKWYGGASFPKEAYRDAAEWTASRLGITLP